MVGQSGWPMFKQMAHVKFLGEFRDVAGTDELDVAIDPPYSLGQLIEKLAETLPPLRSLLYKPREEAIAPFSMLLNGREVYSQGDLTIPVPHDSEVVFFFWGVGG